MSPTPAGVFFVVRAVCGYGAGAGIDRHAGSVAGAVHARHLVLWTLRNRDSTDDLAQIAIDEARGAATRAAAGARATTRRSRAAAAGRATAFRNGSAAGVASAPGRPSGLAAAARITAGAVRPATRPTLTAARGLSAATTADVVTGAAASEQQQQRSKGDGRAHDGAFILGTQRAKASRKSRGRR